MLNLGSSEVLAMKVGTKNVVAVYLGSTLVWSDGARLRGRVQAHSALAGGLSVLRPFAGGISAHAVLSGSLRLAGEVEMGGSLAAHSTLVGAIGVQRSLAGRIAAQSGLAGAIDVEATAAPTVVSKASTTTTPSGSNVTINLPASIVAGNKITVLIGVTGTVTGYSSAGFSLVGTGGTGTGISDRRLWVYEKIADGSEGSTVVFTNTGTAGNVAAVAYQVAGSASATLFAGTGGSGINPDPPNLNPGSSAETLWIAAGTKRQTSALSGTPSGYANAVFPFQSSNVTLAAADKTSTASSEDPGAFTGTGSDGLAAATLGFRA